ncbi:hypothetical protein [Roseibium marinum]|uniref:hypothetical protein n=1 Tax=Roseibium marinum TaxID=281252 RepID=UPI001474BBA5|nr:hypothetical protein [Roseibium marinum]
MSRDRSATAEERALGPRIINGKSVVQDDDNWQWTVSTPHLRRHLRVTEPVGIGCAKPNLYGVYTSVLAFRDWMDKTVKPKL